MKARVLKAAMLGAIFASLAISPLLAAPLQDGPYLVTGSDGSWTSRWVEGDDRSPTAHAATVRVGDEITVKGVGAVPAFKVKLRAAATNAPDEVKLPADAPLFVMADTHGEYQIAVELLTHQKIIDSQLRWSFGKGHFVVLGDVFDRGPNHTEILWLLYQLEAEAKRAGGAVHVLIGNHESLALGGDERYLNPRYLQVRDTLRVGSYESLWSEKTLLGQWLRAKAAVMKIGDYLCLHGGLSREVVDRGLTLAAMNQSVRSSLGDRQPDGFVMSPNGPLWYRGYFPQAARESGSTPATSDDVAKVLAFYRARAIFVGHTIVPTVMPLYDGRVIAVQVYPHKDTATSRDEMQALLVRKGVLYRARIDGGAEPLSP